MIGVDLRLRKRVTLIESRHILNWETILILHQQTQRYGDAEYQHVSGCHSEDAVQSGAFVNAAHGKERIIMEEVEDYDQDLLPEIP